MEYSDKSLDTVCFKCFGGCGSGGRLDFNVLTTIRRYAT